MPDNYFEFYGLPIALALNQVDVRRKYLENSRKYHPDFHTLASDTVQTEALNWSTYNNEAFNTLSDPDKLLQYVLHLKGMLPETGESALPQAFLMEMMDINEKIMVLEFEPELESYQEALSAVKDLESSINDSIGAVLNTWTEADGSTEQLLAAKDYFMKKKYLLRVKENLSKFATAFEK
jgi:molecular chaperone HscB